jgi:hypothetical protein
MWQEKMTVINNKLNAERKTQNAERKTLEQVGR